MKKVINLTEGQSKIYEVPAMESPVYVVLIKGKKRFLQRGEGFNGATQWNEVKKVKYWVSIIHHPGCYPNESNIGDTKKEAIEFLQSKY